MNLKEIHNVYFIGIGGIGMSALARYFYKTGKHVTGYDKAVSNITIDLERLGIKIHFNDSLDLIPPRYKDKTNTLVVFTPAIPLSNINLNFYINNGFKVMKRAEVLGLITKNTFCFAVAGTHGKTTTSAILGHIMQPYKATSFLGGISENYHSNLILGADEISVVEADEFDKSFLQLSPNIACITSMDADHLDVYGKHTFLEDSFQEFANKVSEVLIVAKGSKVAGLSYAIEEEADYKITNIIIKDGHYIFDVTTPNDQINEIVFLLPGKHNMMNALAALAMADSYGIPLENIKKSLETFKGVERRFSYKVRSKTLTLIDDYAHHPTEIKAVYEALSTSFPDDQKCVVFQPHLYSRTQDFMSEFATVLSLFDRVYLLDIYPARELPIAGVTSTVLKENISGTQVELISKDEMSDKLNRVKERIVTILGAGDVGDEVEKVKLNMMYDEV